jgi:DNA-binding transcriptional regulator PaaX
MLKQNFTITTKILKILKRSGSTSASKIFSMMESALATCKIDRRNFKSHWRINYAVRRLRERGWIKLIQTKNFAHYELTPKGYAALSKYELHQAAITPLKRWDNKWRIIVFDVEERKSNLRNKIRRLFERIGLVRLQDSVWICPYPCEDIIELAKTAYCIRRNVIYLVANRFSGDEKLAFNFGIGLNPTE